MEIYIWLGIAIASLILEVATSGLATIWFVPSALVSMVLALFKVPVSIQIASFIVLSALMIVLFYKKLKENIEKKSEKTNIDALIGKECRLLGKGYAFGVMTPHAFKRTALEKDRGAKSVAVVDLHSLDPTYHTRHLKPPFPFRSA